MTYRQSRLTDIELSRDRVVTPAFLLVAAATFFAFLSIGIVLPVLPRFAEGPLGAGSIGVGIAIGAASITALLAQPPRGPARVPASLSSSSGTLGARRRRVR